MFRLPYQQIRETYLIGSIGFAKESYQGPCKCLLPFVFPTCCIYSTFFFLPCNLCFKLLCGLWQLAISQKGYKKWSYLNFPPYLFLGKTMLLTTIHSNGRSKRLLWVGGGRHLKCTCIIKSLTHWAGGMMILFTWCFSFLHMMF